MQHAATFGLALEQCLDRGDLPSDATDTVEQFCLVANGVRHVASKVGPLPNIP
jgi:hypothetical protein